MSLTVTLKQNDTRPIQDITLLQPDPDDPTALIAVDLTLASSAKILASTSPASMPAFTSTLALASDRTTGIVTWTPIASDTAVVGKLLAEIQVTFAGGGVETYPNDGYFEISIVADLG